MNIRIEFKYVLFFLIILFIYFSERVQIYREKKFSSTNSTRTCLMYENEKKRKKKFERHRHHDLPMHQYFLKQQHKIDEYMTYKLSNEQGKSIYDIERKAIEYGLNCNKVNLSLWICTTEKNYKQKELLINEQIKRRKKNKSLQLTIKVHDLHKLSRFKYEAAMCTFEFEYNMKNEIFFQSCKICRSRGINIGNFSSKVGICSPCAKEPLLKKAVDEFNEKKNNERNNNKRTKENHKMTVEKKIEIQQQTLLKNFMLPTWIDDDGKHHFEIPDELKELTVAEQLLISPALPYIPCFHMKQGVFGIQGHCCCFESNTKEICNELPRKKGDLLLIIRYIKVDHRDVRMKTFKVRRTKIVRALHWLMRYNEKFKNIICNEENINDWIGLEEEEGDISKVIDVDSPYCVVEDVNDSAITTISEHQTEIKNTSTDFIYTTTNNKKSMSISKENIDIINQLKESSTVKTTKAYIDSFTLPSLPSDALNEYYNDVFPMMFPTLYPGGYGGFLNKEIELQSFDNIARRLLNFQDGRFQCDKFWCAYVLNFLNRKKAKEKGRFLVKNESIIGKDFTTVEELKEKIQNNDTSFIKNIRYESRNNIGCDNFWRSKRQELISWINYHVEQQKGPPTLFITLSCAEAWWPDLVQCFKEISKNSVHDSLFTDFDTRTESEKRQIVYKASLLFSSVVQEFFLKRFELWMKYVGKPILKITNHWARIEFTKGRGQIHIHMLCITSDIELQIDYHKLKKEGKNEEAVDLLTHYVEVRLGMTAEHPTSMATPDNTESPEIFKKSLTYRYHESDNSVEDFGMLCNSCHIHICNDFCLRPCKDDKGICYCRAGAGKTKLNEKKTDGFTLCEKSKIEVLPNTQVKQLKLRRTNNRRMTQTSQFVLQSWRANCDVQLLIFESDPYNPNLEEIEKVVNYIVSYTTKVNMTTIQEQKMICEIIRNYDISSEDDVNTDLMILYSKILNTFQGKRTISRPEIMVLLNQSQLVHCSEKIIIMNISGSITVKNKNDEHVSSVPSQYRHRKVTLESEKQKSLLEFAYEHYKTSRNKSLHNCIVHPVGRSYLPRFKYCFQNNTIIPFDDYCKAILILHYPWDKNIMSELIQGQPPCYVRNKFEKFLLSNKCPTIVKKRHSVVFKSFKEKGNKFIEHIDKEPIHGNAEDEDDQFEYECYNTFTGGADYDESKPICYADDSYDWYSHEYKVR